MDDHELRKLIEQLHAEIQNTHTVDEKGQELLTHLEADIRELLDQAERNGMQVQPSTLQRLEEGLDHFEATHPALTTLLSNLLETLSNAGV
jgi:DNA polymerase I-like protein with 3'-5' exonuclease and polymerase domains